MKLTVHRLWLLGGAWALAALGQAPMQAPSPGSGGLLNDWLRQRQPAFTNWDVGGQARLRFESKRGLAVPGAGVNAVDFSPQTPANDYWLWRGKVHLGWQPCPWFSVYGEGRDSRTWEDRRRPEPEADTLDVHQAFAVLGDRQALPVTLKVGRQEFSYGDERLVGAFDWNNLGRVFDAAKLRFEDEAFWADAFVGRVVLADDGAFNVANDYDWFSGLYASSRAVLPKHEAQLYVLARNTGPQSPRATTGSPQTGGPPARDIYTLGMRLKSLPGQFGGWDYEAELAGQLGNFLDPTPGRRLAHRALAAHLAGGYTWKQAPATPRLGLEYNFASGDGDPADGEHGTFENLFPTNHKFYGSMDLFSWQNLHHLRLASALRPVRHLAVTLDYHLFWLADTADAFYQVNGAPRGGPYGRRPENDAFVGSEINLVATWTMPRGLAAQAGYGHFFRGDYVKQSLTAGSRDADWAYVQVVLTF